MKPRERNRAGRAPKARERVVLRVLTRTLVVLALVTAGRPGCAEPLPTSGVFEGVYHVDRFGRRRFGFFRVPHELRARFAGLEGRRIRVEVTRGVQTSIPGPVSLKEIGQITEVLDGPALRLTVERRRLGEAVYPTVRVTNQGSKAVTIALRSITLALSSHTDDGRYVASGWGNDAAISRGGRRLRWPLRLLPGRSCAIPFRLRALTIADDAGQHEIEATYRHPDVKCPYQAWLAYDLPNDRPAEAPPRARVEVRSIEVVGGRSTTGRAAEVYRLRLGLSAPSNTAIQLVQQQMDEGTAYVGRLCAWTVDGSEIELAESVLLPGDRAIWDSDRGDAPGTLVPLPEGGAELGYLAVHRRAFPIGRIHAWSLDLLTAEGLERVSFGGEFEDRLYVEPPPLSDEQHGIRLRVRPYRSRRAKPGEQEFVLQVTNETGEPVIFWEIGALSDRCEVRVDGKPASVRERRAGVFGWSAPRTCEKPMEMRFQLPGDQGLPPGRHTITVGLRGVGGTHRNASGAPVPILLGEVWTDETHFLIP